jgi:transcriptional regulator GlxA family with amidase domain
VTRTATRPSIGIVEYPGAQAAAVHGLADLFETANRLREADGDGLPRLEVRRLTVGPGELSKKALTALILPPSVTAPEAGASLAGLTKWIVERHRQGTLVCSVCVGAFLLAETGLLDHRPATTHWALRETFAARFPAVALDTDALVIDDGDIITAGGLMAWVDLGLRLVDRYLGSRVMLTTARYFLVDPGGREQRFYSTFAPAQTHGDAAVLTVQRWLQANATKKVTLPIMAAKAMLGERTFLRRFQRATGYRPTEYVQHLRVSRARSMLETSVQTVDEVAWKVGYEDTGAFRKVFCNRSRALTFAAIGSE